METSETNLFFYINETDKHIRHRDKENKYTCQTYKTSVTAGNALVMQKTKWKKNLIHHAKNDMVWTYAIDNIGNVSIMFSVSVNGIEPVKRLVFKAQ